MEARLDIVSLQLTHYTIILYVQYTDVQLYSAWKPNWIEYLCNYTILYTIEMYNCTIKK